MSECLRRNFARTLVFGLLLLLGAVPACAHSLHLFAEGDGAVIRGKVYFRGGSPAANLQVTAFDPSGRAAGKTQTDARGEFAITVTHRCDYKLQAATSDGHGADFQVSAAELSAELPLSESAEDSLEGDRSTGESPASPVEELQDVSGTTASLADELRGIRAQLSSLRQQMAENEQRTRLRDVVGGIGYIFGLAGVAFYLAARRTGGDRPR